MVETVFRLIPVKGDGEQLGDYGRAISVQCDQCQHLGYELVCKAFPDGIPEPILTGERDHTEPYPGDGGIRYEALEKGE